MMPSDPKFDELLVDYRQTILSAEYRPSIEHYDAETRSRADLVAHHEATMRQSGMVVIPAELAREWREAKSEWEKSAKVVDETHEVTYASKLICDEFWRKQRAILAAIEAALEEEDGIMLSPNCRF